MHKQLDYSSAHEASSQNFDGRCSFYGRRIIRDGRLTNETSNLHGGSKMAKKRATKKKTTKAAAKKKTAKRGKKKAAKRK